MPAPKKNKNALRNDGGRPKIDLSVLWDGWYNDILNLYQKGASDVEIRALIYEKAGVGSYTLWERWIKEEGEFKEVIKMGKILSEAWWAKSGRTNLENKDFSYTGWYMNMKNRFGWADRTTTDVTTKGESLNYTEEERQVRIKKLSSKQ